MVSPPEFGAPIVRLVDVDLSILSIAGEATGDIIFFDGAQWNRRAVGSNDEVLTVVGGVPAWSATMDAVVIGGSTPAAITGTTIDATTDVTVGDTIITDGVITDATGLQIAAVVDMANNAINNIGVAGQNLTASGLVDVGGTSGNIWSGVTLTRLGTGQFVNERTTANIAILTAVATMRLVSTGDMADGFGPEMNFVIEDGGASEVIGSLAFRRAGADDTGDFVLSTYITGTQNESFRVTSGGLGSFDLAGAGDALPTLFDDYDDAMVLREAVGLRGVELLEEMGIAERKDTGSGWWMNLQPYLGLLRGGIVQNRQGMDAGFADMDRRLKALGV